MRFGVAFYKKVPIFRWLIAFAIGIVVSFYCTIPLYAIVLAALLSVGTIVYFSFCSLAINYRFGYVNGGAIMLLFVCLGFAILHQYRWSNRSNYLGKYYTGAQPYWVVLQETPITKAKTYKAKALVKAVFVANQWRSVKAQTLLYFYKTDTIASKLQYGNQLIIQSALQSIPKAANPGAMNYHEYCSFQNIDYQVFVASNKYIVLDSLEQSAVVQHFQQVQQFVLTTLKKYIHQSQAVAVAEALLIGYRNDLDKDLLQAYSTAGIVHIIAISGLHLAMLYSLLVVLLRPFKNLKGYVYMEPIIIIVVLWWFAFLAGAAPSVIRSAIMCSCMAIGKSVQKKANAYNTLAISAMLILVFQPFSLWDVGFQLSFAAVVSILLFSHQLQKLVSFRNKLLLHCWQLLCITMAAQILTLPIVLYHFHQMPTLFLGTNVIAVPLSALILYGEILLLVVAAIPILPVYIGKMLEFCLVMLNKYIAKVAILPFAAFTNVAFLWPQVFCCIAALLLLYGWLYYRQATYLLTSLLCFVVATGIGCWDALQKKGQLLAIVYQVPKQTAIDVVAGNGYRFIGNKAMFTNESSIHFFLQPTRIRYRLYNLQASTAIVQHPNCIYSANKKIILVNRGFTIPKGHTPIAAHTLIVCQNAPVTIPQLRAAFTFDQLIFDGSNSLWKISKWKKDCDSLHLRHHCTPTDGAAVIQL